MKIKKIWIAVAVLAVCISVLWAVDRTESQTSPQFTYIVNQKDTLTGLQGVYVVVEILRPEVEKYGLTRQQLQTDVELRLRQNGIKVLSGEERLSAPGMPYLYVNVPIMKVEEIPLVVYSISVQLWQRVLLTRDPNKIYIASTWDTGFIGCAGLDRIESIRESVKNYVDAFINDYLAVNPKK
jgi:hypothetical protein